MANQGGDRGKSPNETGTQPTVRKKDYPNPKAGKASGQGAGKSRQAGPKKVAARTTKKSRDK